MHIIDMRTVVFGQAAIALVCACMLGLLYWHGRRRYDGIGYWAGAYLLQALGVGLMLTRGLLPDLLSVAAANVLGVASFPVLAAGFSRFWGRRHAPLADFAMLAVFSGVHLYFTFQDPSLRLRTLNLNFWLAAFFLRCGWLLYGRAPAGLRAAARGPALALAGFALVCFARLALAFTSPPAEDFFAAGQADGILVFCFQLLTVLSTMGLFLLVNRRIVDDTRADYEGRIAAERALAGALKTAKLGTWTWEIGTGRVHWSDEMYSIFGLDPKGFAGDIAGVIARSIHPDDKAAVEASNRSVAEEGRPMALDYRVLTPAGQRWVHAEASELVKDGGGRPATLKGYAQDITAAKEAAERLRESAARLELALESAAMGLWRWDVKEDRRYFDDRVCALLGLDKNAFTGRGEEFFAVVSPGDRPVIKAAMAETLATDALYHPEYRVVTPDGGVRWVAARGRLRRDGQGRPWLVEGLLWDITEKKASESAIQSAQKLDALGALAGGIAHDFNNLLTGITGNLSLLGLKAGGNPELAEIVREAELACRTAGGLARQLLTFAAGGEPVKKPLDLARLARESAAFSLRGSGVAVDFDLQDGVHVLGDRDQLFQAVQNLALNAAQAAGGSGRISVRVFSGKEPDGRPYGAVAVRDRGPGMPEAVRARLFEPYFSTKGKGRGLGLPVCRSITLRHGGRIAVESAEGDGSMFTVVLPLTEEKPEITGRRPAAAPKPAGARVLVMDDEEVVYKALTRMLTALGYEPEVAVNGEQALAAWRAAAEQGRPFGAVIMDLTISGGMGGAEAVKKLKALDPAAKAVVSSGYSEDPVMADHAAYGFDAALPKPFRVDDVEGVLKQLLGD